MADAPYETSDRGFRHYEPTPTSYGHEVRIYESSAAMEPHLWLSVELTPENARDAGSNIEPGRQAAHMTLDQAEEVYNKLGAAIRDHYQVR